MWKAVRQLHIHVFSVFISLCVRAQDLSFPLSATPVKYIKINVNGTFFPLVDLGLDPLAQSPTKLYLTEITPTVHTGTILGIKRVGGYSDGVYNDDSRHTAIAVFVDSGGNPIKSGPATNAPLVNPYPFCVPPPDVGPLLDYAHDFNVGEHPPTTNPAIEYEVEVPSDAIALLFAPGVCAVSGNSDTDGDYGVEMRVKLEQRDLVASPMTIVGAKTDLNSGQIIIPVNQHIQVQLPISVYNLSGDENSETTIEIKLEAGSQSQTGYLRLRQLLDNQNKVNALFNMRFQDSDIGPMTFKASVNTNRGFREVSYDNNQAIQQVFVSEEKYRIIKQVRVNNILQPDGVQINIEPSRLTSCRSSKPDELKEVNIKLFCVKDLIGGASEIVEDCKVKSALNWYDAGPHNHLSDVDGNNTESELAHLGSLVTVVNGNEVPVSEESLNIPIDGLDLTYKVSDFAGIYSISFYDIEVPNNKYVNLDEAVIKVSIEQKLVSIDDLLEFNVTSHPGDGFYATPLMRDRLAEGINLYRQEAFKLIEFLRQILRDTNGEPLPGVNNLRIPRLISGGASLSWGGAFDIRRNWKADSSVWKTIVNSEGKLIDLVNGHCTHRQGTQIDVSMTPFNNIPSIKIRKMFLERLNDVFNDKKLVFPVGNESIKNKKATHWHAQPK